MDASGSGFAVWAQVDLVNAVYDVVANRYQKQTSQWSGATVVDGGNVSANPPVIAMDGLGNAVVAWKTSPGDDIMVTRYSAGAGTWATPIRVDTGTPASSLPRVAISMNGNAFVVWQQSDGVATSLWANRSTATSGWVGASVVETASEPAGNPHVATDSRGNFMVVWGQGSSDWSRRYVAGAGWDTPASFDAGSLLGLAMTEDGNAVVLTNRSGLHIAHFR